MLYMNFNLSTPLKCIFCIQILFKFSFICLKRKLLAFQTSITSHNDDKCVSLALIMNGFLAVALYYFV